MKRANTMKRVAPRLIALFFILFLNFYLRLKHKQPTKRKVRRRRLRTVIENLMLCASHFTKHARRLIMALGCSNTWRHAFWGVWQRFALT